MKTSEYAELLRLFRKNFLIPDYEWLLEIDSDTVKKILMDGKIKLLSFVEFMSKCQIRDMDYFRSCIDILAGKEDNYNFELAVKLLSKGFRPVLDTSIAYKSSNMSLAEWHQEQKDNHTVVPLVLDILDNDLAKRQGVDDIPHINKEFYLEASKLMLASTRYFQGEFIYQIANNDASIASVDVLDGLKYLNETVAKFQARAIAMLFTDPVSLKHVNSLYGEKLILKATKRYQIEGICYILKSARANSIDNGNIALLGAPLMLKTDSFQKAYSVAEIIGKAIDEERSLEYANVLLESENKENIPYAASVFLGEHSHDDKISFAKEILEMDSYRKAESAALVVNNPDVIENNMTVFALGMLKRATSDEQAQYLQRAFCNREALEAKVAVCYAEKILATRDRNDWQTILEDEEDTFLSVNNYRGKPDRVIRALEEASELKDAELTKDDLTKAVQYSKKREKEIV